MPSSLVIRGGTVIDGTGAAPRRADVAVDGDRIVAIGEIGEHVAARVLDATGLAVTPGFINILSHAWGSLQLEPRGPSDLLQGVTTEVFGEAFSLGPSAAEFTEVVEAFGLRHGQRVDFPRLAEGLDHLERSGIAPNVASFIGGHNLRVLGAGLTDARLDPEALDRLRGIVAEEMADGALGIGTALIYPPGCFADTDELVALCEVVGRYDGLYISHMRSEGDRFIECLDELIEIGRRAAVRAEVYHLKAAGRANWPKMKLAIERIEAARESGQVVGANMYPYTAGGTSLSASIPPPYHVGGPAALAARRADPAERARMAADISRPSAEWENLYLAAGGGEGVLLLSAGGRGGELVGRRLDAIARERGQDEAETLLDLVALDPTIGAAYFIIDEDNVELGLAQPWVSVGSDAEALATEAPWTDQPTHPRSYGTFARVLGHYSRDRGLFPLADAVRKMTSLPADTLRLADRGRLVVGAAADLVVLDPAQVADRASYEDSHRY
ncbi:MAG: N-acyl-D-amino-acid deacylase family protein, partial [Mycobacteriales bacterium]